METQFKKEIAGNQIRLLAYKEENEIGQISALTDGHEWALICELQAETEKLRKELIHHIVLELEGHEIFVVADPEELDLYEGQDFIRSKNGFTYIGRELSQEQEEALAENKLFLPLGFKYETEFEAFAGNFPVGKKTKRTDVDPVYTNETENVDYDQVNTLLEKAFGGERDKSVTEDAFKRSDYVQYGYDGDKLIGCARAISDGTQALILNVAVDPEYQGISLGWNIVKKLSEQMDGQRIFLNTHPGGVGFYNRKGFRRNKTALMHLAHQMPDEIKRGFCLPVGYRFPDEYER